MPGGRPTKYKPEYCKELVAFFSVSPFEDIEVEYTNKKGETWSKFDRRANSLPKFHEFAKKIGVCHDTLIEWASGRDKAGELKHPEFSEAYKTAKELQKWFLIENGLNGLYNATFAIFTAKNVTDMRDVQAVEHSGDLTISKILKRYDDEAAGQKLEDQPAVPDKGQEQAADSVPAQ